MTENGLLSAHHFHVSHYITPCTSIEFTCNIPLVCTKKHSFHSGRATNVKNIQHSRWRLNNQANTVECKQNADIYIKGTSSEINIE
jgi:hypothetical protein